VPPAWEEEQLGFNLKRRSELFLRNLPFHPIHFATLEIEIKETPAVIRGLSFFADSRAPGFDEARKRHFAILRFTH
jgi:hypothetical protein